MGVAIAMQGSAIPFCDVGGATIKINDEGHYTLLIGAADMGTGCDTILAQVAAEVLECDLDNITVFGADTDASPYDSGSYASSTTYITGKAVEVCAQRLRGKICQLGAKILGCEAEQVLFDGKEVRDTVSDKAVSLFDIATASMVNNNIALEETVEQSSVLSPPPFMAVWPSWKLTWKQVRRRLLTIMRPWTAVRLSTRIWPRCRPRAASYRALVWR